MTYSRVIHRNGLTGDYSHDGKMDPDDGAISGDLRRLESDQRDALHLEAYARYAGITVEQARKVLDAFFANDDITHKVFTYEEYEERYGALPWVIEQERRLKEWRDKRE